MPDELVISYLLPSYVQKKTKITTRPQNLTAYFPMDEAQGLSTKEMVSGKMNNFIGGTTWSEGVIGSALRFDGTNGYLPTELTGKDLGIDGKKARTISFWVNAEGIGKSDSGFYGYGSLLNSDGTNQYWTIRRIDNTNFSRFQSEHWGWSRWISHGTSLLSSGWVHFAHIYDGNNIMVYRDASRVDNVARAQIGTGNQIPLQIGRWRNETNAYFYGSIDDFRVYDDALTETEIQTISVGQDLFVESKDMQFVIEASENPTQYTVDGSSSGLIADSLNGEVYGLAQEVVLST